MRFKSDQKLAGIILGNHMLLRVLDRFNIPLGFGDMTVAEICEKHQIHIPFFLEVLNTFHDPEYRPEPDSGHFPVSVTVEYLNKAHRYYLESKVPEIGQMIRKLVDNAGELKGKMSAIIRFFDEYTRELTFHINREEEKVFPYALQLEQANSSSSASPDLISKIREYPVSAYAGEHDDVEEKLLDLKSILIKYIDPSLDHEPVRKVLDELFALEADLNDHSRLEDLILVPVLKPMEEKLLKLEESK